MNFKLLAVSIFIFLADVICLAQTEGQYNRLSKEEWSKKTIPVDGWAKSELSERVDRISASCQFLIIHEVREAQYEGRIPNVLSDCVGNYNSDFFNFKIWELNAVGNTKCKLEINGKSQDSNTYSTFFFATKDAELEEIIFEKRKELSIEKVAGSDFFQSEGISSESDFCWKLGQLKHEVERFYNGLIVKRKLEADGNRPQIYLSLSGGMQGISLQRTQTNYEISDSRVASSSFDLSVLFRLDSTNRGLNFYAGPALSYDKSTCLTRFSDFRNSRKLDNSDLDSLIIYGSSIVESNSFKSIALGCDFKVEKVKKSGFVLALTVQPYLRLPFMISSSLDAGSFNYRGHVDSIGEEMINIPALGLSENINAENFTSVDNVFSGYGFISKLSVGFEKRGHGFRVSPFFGIDRIISQSLSSDDFGFMSPNIDTYKSTWNNTGKFSMVKYGVSLEYVYKFKMK